MGMMRRGNREEFEFNFNRTSLGYTRTSDGDIKHMPVFVGDYVFYAPVKLMPRLRGDPLFLKPVVRNMRYVHALPDGGECIGEKAL